MKTESYSTDEAKARFSELLRKVKQNKRIVITYQGEPVAEIGPVSGAGHGLEDRLRQLETHRAPPGPCPPSAPSRGEKAR